MTFAFALIVVFPGNPFCARVKICWVHNPPQTAMLKDHRCSVVVLSLPKYHSNRCSADFADLNRCENDRKPKGHCESCQRNSRLAVLLCRETPTLTWRLSYNGWNSRLVKSTSSWWPLLRASSLGESNGVIVMDRLTTTKLSVSELIWKWVVHLKGGGYFINPGQAPQVFVFTLDRKATNIFN